MLRRITTRSVFSVCIALTAALLINPGFATADDPDLVFRTIETEHFEIHYHQGLQRVARMAASICEEVHENLAIMFQWEVDGPTHIVITDHTDSSNGVTYVNFRPLIRLYVTAPELSNELQPYDYYMRELITHEYSHMISLRMHSGVSRVINAIFGDVYFPNTFSPRWYHEGIAVLNETYETTAGRIRSSYYRMIMRANALEGRMLSLGEVSNDSRLYPRGVAHYCYGAMFMDYLRENFGQEKVVELYRVYGSKPIPYGLNRTFKEVFGKDMVTLYDEWLTSVKADAKNTEQELAKRGITRSTAVTSDGESKGRPIFGADSGSVIMGVGNGMGKTGIYRVPLDGSARELLALSGSKPDLSMDRSGRLFYTRSAPFKTHYWFNDVFALDRPDQDPRRVTNGARAQGAAISPRGDRLVMATNDAGTTKLVLADERGNFIRVLVDSKDDDQVFVPVWSPDGNEIALVIRRGPKVDLALLDLGSGALEFITDDRALEGAPAYDPSGRYLLFTSDRTGISNIYARDSKSKELFQVTNVVNGAYFPAVSPDGRTLAFVYYTSHGYDLHVMPFRRDSWLQTGEPEAELEDPEPLPPPSEAESKPYNPLPTLLPAYWMAGLTMDSDSGITVQALTAVSDAVGRHNIAAEINYRIEDTNVSGRAGYSYFGLGPGLHLGFSYTSNPRDSGYSVDGESRRWIQDVAQGSASLSFYIPGLDRSHSLSLGYSVIHAEPRDEPEVLPDPEADLPEVPTQYFRTGVELGWSFRDTVSSPMGISPHKGRALAASVSFYHPSLGGDQTLASFRYNWTEYIGMPWLKYHVLALRLTGGVNVSDPPEQAAFYVGGYGEQNIIDTIINNSPAGQPYLRGYPTGAFQGDRFHSLKMEYRMPIWFAEATYATLPVFLKRVEGSVFTDNAVISFDRLDRDDWRSSLGAELVWVVTLSYFQSMTVRTGYAYGFMDGGLHEIILVIGGGF